MGLINPVQETQAAVIRKEKHLSTGSREAAELTGMDYEAIIHQIAKEMAMERRIFGQNELQRKEMTDQPDHTEEGDADDDTDLEDADESSDSENRSDAQPS